jgi:hypothetical protein
MRSSTEVALLLTKPMAVDLEEIGTASDAHRKPGMCGHELAMPLVSSIRD